MTLSVANRGGPDSLDAGDLFPTLLLASHAQFCLYLFVGNPFATHLVNPFVAGLEVSVARLFGSPLLLLVSQLASIA